MSEKVKVVAVSYLNTKPLLYGLLNHPVAEQLELELEIPSICAEKLQSGSIDLGLVPVAIIPELDSPYIISDYCIGTVGSVQTVAIFSHCPIDEIESIYLDYHSRTSVELARILMREHWKIQPKELPTGPGFEEKIKDRTAALIIGDRAMGLEGQYPYIYDLGEAWQQHTGLPFVFAAWVSNKPLSPEFIQAFNEAIKKGLEQIPQLIFLIPPPVKGYDLKAYFTNYISYELDEEKKKALSLFLDLYAQSSPTKPKPELVFS